MTARNVHVMKAVTLVKCCVCGSRANLHRHHIIPRSVTQNDDPENLAVLCATDHRRIHNKEIDLGPYLSSSQQAKAVLLMGTIPRATPFLYPSENPKVAA